MISLMCASDEVYYAIICYVINGVLCYQLTHFSFDDGKICALV